MAKGEEITTKFKVDISDLKKGISEANNQIKLANAQFKAATAGMDNWAKSTDGIKAKLAQLDSVLNSQKSKLTSYNQQLSRQQEAYNENGKRVEELKAKLQELANNGVSKTSEEYKKYENALAACEKEQESNKASIDSLKVTILNQEAAIGKTEKEINNYGQALNTLESEQQAAAEAANKQATAYEKLQSTIDKQQSDLDELKRKYADVVVEQGKNSDAAKELAGEIDSLSSELAENKKSLNEADKAADDLDHSLEELDPEGEAQGFTVLKGALANLVADGIRMAITAIQDFAKETIEVGKQFDKSMSNVAALSGATGEELNMLRDTAKEFGSTTQFSASEAADALGYMALAGWGANQSADALGGVLNLAAASGMDLAEASDMVTDYMSAFGMEAEQSAYFADLLAYAQANANTTAAGLGEAFKNVAANANAAGQDIETTTAFLAMMANQGLKGSEAGTALNAVMRDMTAKMKDGAIAIGDTNVQVMDADGNYRDLTDILMDVEAATQGMGDAQKAAALSSTFTSDSIKGLNLILNAGVGEAAKFEQQLRNSGGSAEKMSSIMNDNLNGDLTAFKSKLEGVQISLYEKFEPALRKGVDALNGLLDALQWVVDHSSEFIAALTAMGAGVAAYLAYTTALKIMTQGWQSLAIVQKAVAAGQAVLNAVMSANPIGLVIAAVAALVAAFVTLWNKSEAFREFWIGLWDKIKEVAQPVIDFISAAFSAAWDTIQEVWGVVSEWFKKNVFDPIWNSLKPVIESVKKAFKEAWKTIKAVWDVVKPYFEKLWNAIKTTFSVVKDVLGSFFKAAWEAIKTVWDVVGPYFEALWNTITNIFSVVKTFFEGMFKSAWEAIKAIWDAVTGYFQAIWDSIAKIFSVVRSVLTGDFQGAWDGIKSIVDTWKGYFQGVWDGIKNVFSSVKSWFSNTFSSAWTAIKNVFSGWGSFFGGLWETVKSKFTSFATKISASMSNAAKGVINSAISKIESAVNKGIGFINSAIRAINKILPGSPVGTVGTVKLPRLAQGGVLKRGQIGLLEGSGAEAVVPLERNKQWIRAVANDMLQELQGGVAGGTVSNNISKSNVNNFTQIINAPKQPSRIELYRQTRNLLAYANATGSV